MAKVSRKNLELAKKELKSYDDLCSEMEKKIKKEYQQAHKEVAKKAEDYFKRFEKKDATWQKWVKDGTKTEQEYKAWRSGQMAMGQRWNDMRDVLATDLVNTDKIASSIMNDYIPDAYALGHNWGTYEVETGAKVDTSYTLYNRAAVEELLRDDPSLLPKSKVDIPKDKIWNKRHLDSAITQGILQGESIPAIAKRLEAVTDMNHKAALRNARTMTGSAENAGHYASYKRAENMGIKLEKQWIATLDSRTRTSHRYLHGETQKMDDMFSNGLMYPKDPDGAPEEVYNCRCRLVSNVIGYSRDLPTYSEKMGDMSYEEWLEAKPVSQSITHGEEVAQAQKMRYINEYRRGAKTAVKQETADTSIHDLQKPIRPRQADYGGYTDEFLQAREQYRQDMADYNDKIAEIVKRSSDDIAFNTIDDAKAWASANGISISDDVFNSIDLRSFNEVKPALDEMFERFPEVKSYEFEYYSGEKNNTGFNIGLTNDGLLSANGGFNFNSQYFQNYEKGLTEALEGVSDGTLVRGDGSFKTLVRHEYGHNVQNYIELKLSDKYHMNVDDWRKNYSTFDEYTQAREKYFSERRAYENELLSLAGLNGSSEYSNTNTLELFAEGFAEYSSGSKTEFGIEFGKFLDRWY